MAKRDPDRSGGLALPGHHVGVPIAVEVCEAGAVRLSVRPQAKEMVQRVLHRQRKDGVGVGGEQSAADPGDFKAV